MLAIFILKKESPKTTQFFNFLKSCYFEMGGSINMNVGMFVGFLKNVILHIFSIYSQGYVDLNGKSSPKFNGL